MCNSILCEFYSYEEAVNKMTGNIYGIVKVIYDNKIVKMFSQNKDLAKKLKDINRLSPIRLKVEIKATAEESRFALIPFDIDLV